MTVGEAREALSRFLAETGCYSICKECPVYPGEGCCNGCSFLAPGEGCRRPNLSCLSYTCSVLNWHLLQLPDEEFGNKLNRFVHMSYRLPKEGYRGQELRDSEEEIEFLDLRSF